MRKRPARWWNSNSLAIATCTVVVLSTFSCELAAAAGSEPETSGGPPVIRRLTPSQYRQSIEDVFGAGIQLGGRFEPDVRLKGLTAIGAASVSVTASGFEQYDTMARSVAAQVLDESHRRDLLPCKPVKPTQPDDLCAGVFLSSAGRLLFRRPLTSQELQTEIRVANSSARSLGDFYEGLQLGLADLLVSPMFLFRHENVEPDPDHPGKYRLDAFSKASQISFLLWNTTPDDELLRAAESGELNTQRGLQRQVDRLLGSPMLESGIRAFFTDMLGFDQFATLSKDATLYPKFTPKAVVDAQEQTLRTIVDLLITQKGDYRDLFTSRRTFLTPTLGVIYGVPVMADTPIGTPEQWVPHEYPEGDPRSGLLTQASFVALHAHPGRSSPTIRGKALRELVLCQKVPDPPANVDFKVVQDTTNPLFRTARERVTAHRTMPTCAGCHKMIDPMGLALENFDGAAGFRTLENGAKIDTSGELDGIKFDDAAGLGRAVHDNPATPACLVSRLYSYGSGRAPVKSEAAWIRQLGKQFASDGYRVPDLLRRIATGDALYRATAPAPQLAETEAPRAAVVRNESTRKEQP
jgi:hypothetical protein